MEISDMNSILNAEPIQTSDINIGYIANQYYNRTSLLSRKYEITRLLYDHARFKQQFAQSFWHCQPVALEYLTAAHEYTRTLNTLSERFLKNENELLLSKNANSIDWLTNTRTLREDGLRFLSAAIEETGHFFAGLSQGLAEEDARIYSQKIMARYSAVKQQDYTQAEQLTQDICNLTKTNTRGLSFFSNE